MSARHLRLTRCHMAALHMSDINLLSIPASIQWNIPMG